MARSGFYISRKQLIADNSRISNEKRDLAVAATRARELLRRLLAAKKLGVEYAEANQICHELTASLGEAIPPS